MSDARARSAEPPAAESGIAVIVTCEHGSRRVPDEYRALFSGAAAARALESHRAWDEGAAEVAGALAARLGARLFVGDTTRLLVDLNRSLGHPRLFSELMRGSSAAERARVLERHYRPYRDAVETAIVEAARGGPVLHVSSHSFAPVLEGDERRADIGLLFDPRRPEEAAFAAMWREALRRTLPSGSVIRRNYPYRGVSDGFTTHLRKRFCGDVYSGLELEVNQRHVGGLDWPRYLSALAESLEAAICGSLSR